MAEHEGKTIILDDGTRVPAYNNGVPYPAHVAAEDLSDGSTREHSPRGDGALDDPEDFPNCYDTHSDLMDGVFPQSVDGQGEDDNDSHLADDSELDEEDEEGSSDRDDEAAAESDSPRGRFLEFAGNTAALFDSMVSSVLSNKNLQELSFGVASGDIGAYFSIKLRR